MSSGLPSVATRTPDTSKRAVDVDMGYFHPSEIMNTEIMLGPNGGWTHKIVARKKNKKKPVDANKLGLSYLRAHTNKFGDRQNLMRDRKQFRDPLLEQKRTRTHEAAMASRAKMERKEHFVQKLDMERKVTIAKHRKKRTAAERAARREKRRLADENKEKERLEAQKKADRDARRQQQARARIKRDRRRMRARIHTYKQEGSSKNSTMGALHVDKEGRLAAEQLKKLRMTHEGVKLRNRRLTEDVDDVKDQLNSQVRKADAYKEEAARLKRELELFKSQYSPLSPPPTLAALPKTPVAKTKPKPKLKPKPVPVPLKVKFVPIEVKVSPPAIIPPVQPEEAKEVKNKKIDYTKLKYDASDFRRNRKSMIGKMTGLVINPHNEEKDADEVVTEVEEIDEDLGDGSLREEVQEELGESLGEELEYGGDDAFAASASKSTVPELHEELGESLGEEFDYGGDDAFATPNQPSAPELEEDLDGDVDNYGDDGDFGEDEFEQGEPDDPFSPPTRYTHMLKPQSAGKPSFSASGALSAVIESRPHPDRLNEEMEAENDLDEELEEGDYTADDDDIAAEERTREAERAAEREKERIEQEALAAKAEAQRLEGEDADRLKSELEEQDAARKAAAALVFAKQKAEEEAARLKAEQVAAKVKAEAARLKVQREEEEADAREKKKEKEREQKSNPFSSSVFAEPDESESESGEDSDAYKDAFTKKREEFKANGGDLSAVEHGNNSFAGQSEEKNEEEESDIDEDALLGMLSDGGGMSDPASVLSSTKEKNDEKKSSFRKERQSRISSYKSTPNLHSNFPPPRAAKSSEVESDSDDLSDYEVDAISSGNALVPAEPRTKLLSTSSSAAAPPTPQPENKVAVQRRPTRVERKAQMQKEAAEMVVQSASDSSSDSGSGSGSGSDSSSDASDSD